MQLAPCEGGDWGSTGRLVDSGVSSVRCQNHGEICDEPATIGREGDDGK